MGLIYLLTGEIQSGKTHLCLDIIKLARRDGIRLGGVVSPGVFEGNEKTAIDLLDIRTGERRRLAEQLSNQDPVIATQRWAFKPEGVVRGNQILENAVPCDLLIIDEFGPLEFQRGEGWVRGFETVESGDFRSALLVIRPSLVEEALERWEVERIINLDVPDEELQTGEDLYLVLLGGGADS